MNKVVFLAFLLYYDYIYIRKDPFELQLLLKLGILHFFGKSEQVDTHILSDNFHAICDVGCMYQLILHNQIKIEGYKCFF